MPARAYPTRRRPARAEGTRERIMSAVRELLDEGSFHASTVEEVADRAGMSRATLYQYFGSRLELVDAICDTFAVNPALLKIREVVELSDPEAALDETMAATVRFWSSEDGILSQLYGVVAVDPAAQALVGRQREDRRGEMQRLVRHLRKSSRARKGLSESRALAQLMVLTSYEAFRELREVGMSDPALTKALQEDARRLLLG